MEHDKLIELCRECTSFDLSLLLKKISDRIVLLSRGEKTPLKDLDVEKSQEHNETPSTSNKLENSFPSEETPDKCSVLPMSTVNFSTTRLLVLLVLMEFGFHYDVFPPALINGCVGKTLQVLHENQNLESMVRVKAKKLSLITSKFI